MTITTPNAKGHEHLGAPLLGNPGAAFESVSEWIGVREAAIEDDFPDLDVPEGAGVVEAALAEGDEQDEPDGEEKRRLRTEQSLQQGSLLTRPNTASASLER